MSIMDPVLLSFLILVVAVMAWNYMQTRSLSRRLTTLEKEYLALVQDLEERLYR